MLEAPPTYLDGGGSLLLIRIHHYKSRSKFIAASSNYLGTTRPATAQHVSPLVKSWSLGHWPFSVTEATDELAGGRPRKGADSGG